MGIGSYLGLGTMKYMGSKRVMLKNGLGELLLNESRHCNRIVDLFCGASSVSWFVAVNIEKPVLAVDLQHFAVILASSVIGRTDTLSLSILEQEWLELAAQQRVLFPEWQDAKKLDDKGWNTITWRKRAQDLCATNGNGENRVIWQAYGGHYFSPTQALTFDAMLSTLPQTQEKQQVCLAATIISASRCAAAPGHTAQPFKATRTAGKYLREAWQRPPLVYARRAVRETCLLHAKLPGQAIVSDANMIAKQLDDHDLVFIDPPYSGVHYSRFYHVLETIARGSCGPVQGIGRYPPPEERPVSRYSMKSKSYNAMNDLIKTLSQRGSKAIITFPNDNCSNGLSGEMIESIAHQYFNVIRRSVKTRFSTLGGNSVNRDARKLTDELILVLEPK